MHIFLTAHARLLVTMTGKKHLTFSILCAILFGLSGRERPDRAWYLGVAQLVARYLGVVEAARSSRVTQTKKPSSFVQDAQIRRLFLIQNSLFFVTFAQSDRFCFEA